jgi:WD40 repeat protein
MTAQEKKEQEARGVEAISWKQPPLESQLADNTLWLEIKKLYGHNNEVVTMKMSGDGRWLASSSKARYTQSCHVIIWSLEGSNSSSSTGPQMSLVTKLENHESTVVCLDFSYDNK